MGIHSSACDTVALAANIYISEVGSEHESERARAADYMLGAGVSQSAIGVTRQAGRQTKHPTGRSKGKDLTHNSTMSSVTVETVNKYCIVRSIFC